MQNRHRLSKKPTQTLFFFKDKDFLVSLASTPKNLGGAERDRTADPLLAKQVLSQLSYSPIRFALTCRAPFGLALRGRAERSATTYRSV